MDCPRCEGPLASYELGEREASVCEHCGWVGVAVDHQPTPLEVESWEEALRRFRDQHR